MNSWFSLVLIVTALCVLADATASEPPADTAKAMQVIREKYGFPGLAALVVKDGKVCDLATVGVRKTGESAPLTTNDVFHIGSCTKSMTATLAALLIEKGALRWDTTIAKRSLSWPAA